MISDNDDVVVSPDRVAWSRSGDQLIVLDLATSTYLSLNGSASVLWERLIAGKVRVSDLAAALQTQFGIPGDVAHVDARDFVDDLAARGFIDRAGP